MLSQHVMYTNLTITYIDYSVIQFFYHLLTSFKSYEKMESYFIQQFYKELLVVEVRIVVFV
jgi:hypothetical protein